MEVVDVMAGQVTLNSIIRVLGQATMAIEVMVGGMGGLKTT